MMDYAKRSKRIQEIPPFPKKQDYGILEPDFDWYTEEEQMTVINTILLPDRYIFLFLKFHYRRIAEACVLHKTDFDVINKAFWIRRSVSDRQIVNTTKTGVGHYIPCHSKFFDIAKKLSNDNLDSPFLFVNPRARKEGKRYTNKSINNVWKKACKKVGIRYIPPYRGLKHSSCTQFINEYGGTDSELQMLTDHARLDSVKKYRKIDLNRKRELMERGKVLDMDYFKTTSKQKK
jgi:integrase